ncbi:MAG TPA: hypothetical protein VK464_18670, partial [Symbiobacteriaceae bacterium]|nr:hypothetical protein [Symbiobacteriaceae bacterium]
MQRKGRLVLCLATGLLLTTAVMARASPPTTARDVTDFGRTPWRTHDAAEEPQYPASPGVGPEWEVPLGLSRSQPLVVQRDFDGDGRPETRIFHLAGDRLWALNGDMRNVPPRQPDQSVEAYRQQLTQSGFILWSTPAAALCAEGGPRRRDDLLNTKCLLVGPNPQVRPFASSHAAYFKGSWAGDDVIYAGFGHPAAVAAIRATTGEVLGGYIVDARGDRGIVGA